MALDCIDSTNCAASGSIMMTKQISLVFHADVDTLYIKLNTEGLTADDNDLNEICGNDKISVNNYHLYGHPKAVDSIKKNDITADLCGNPNVELSFIYVF